jgi:predicted metalloprotease with PDZ domain
MRPTLLISALFLFANAVSAQEPVRYTLRFPAPHTHYVEVEASIPAGKPSVDLFMAVWTPGSYLVREYARHVEDFRAADEQGRTLAWEKTRKNRWRVQAAGVPRIRLNYKVWAHEPSVQGNWVDAGFAMLNGAPNFITLAGAEKRPYEVTLELPPDWKKSISGMKRTGAHAYRANDFDELLDCPIYAGNAPLHEFEVEGKKHYLVNEGEGPMWDGPASAQAVKKIVEEYARMWNGLPYEFYVFFNMIVEQGGGLEHRNSTWMNTSRWAWSAAAEPPPGQRRASRLSWLGLVSHEYFHAWNVKRLRPVELGPFDYENEVYTKSLWLSEGVTSYYGPLALRRAGLSTQAQFLRALSATISQLQTTPGRLVLPVESASQDAWIKLYRPDENTPNTAISYYTKGAVIGFLLDAKVRKLTANAKSLDDVMRLAYRRYAGERGFTPIEFRKTASEVAGADLSSWFHTVLETTAELDYSEALDWYGLRFRGEGPERIVTGITTRVDNGRLVVSGLRRDTPAYEIIAVNGIRVRPEQWPARLDSYKPGETVQLLVARRDQLMTIALPLAAEKPAAWSLEALPGATDQQKANLKAWLGE